MKKQQIEKLALSRETLHTLALEVQTLRFVAGGEREGGGGISQTGGCYTLQTYTTSN